MSDMNDDTDYDDKAAAPPAVDEIRRSIGAIAPDSPHAKLVNPRFIAMQQQKAAAPPTTAVVAQPPQSAPTAFPRAQTPTPTTSANNNGGEQLIAGMFMGACALAAVGLVVYGVWKIGRSVTTPSA